MRRVESFVFKRADEAWEFEAIHRLNYATFVEEIPQHTPDPARSRVDRFHAENEYVIAVHEAPNGERTLAAMVAFRARRPWSLDQKLADVDRYLPKGRSFVEARLLAVDRRFRRSGVLLGLLAEVIRVARTRGWDCALISGTTRQLALYERLGFEAFGPLVGSGDALFQPMYLLVERMLELAPSEMRAAWRSDSAISFMPGPVAISRSVRRAFAVEPRSHRGDAFLRQIADVRARLCRATGAEECQIAVGSGTLANDMIAAQLSRESGRGLVLANGEFGERLIDHARRAELQFDVARAEWGEGFDERELAQRMSRSGGVRWLWATHGETSTGVLNDAAMLKRITGRVGASLCLDCTSTIGVVPLDLGGVRFAACTSGKALGSYPGLAIVFHPRELPTGARRLPRYLDLRAWRDSSSVPYTHSSNLVAALDEAIAHAFEPQRFAVRIARTRRIRERLRELGHRIVAADEIASPAVTTIALPREISAGRIGLRLEREGILIAWRSGYLVERNWLQVCLMGENTDEDVELLLSTFERFAALRSETERRVVAR